jgi:hypothetical protein
MSKSKIKKCGTHSMPTQAELIAKIDAIMLRAATKGWVVDSGRRRNGQIVWVKGLVPVPGLDEDK